MNWYKKAQSNITYEMKKIEELTTDEIKACNKLSIKDIDIAPLFLNELIDQMPKNDPNDKFARVILAKDLTIKIKVKNNIIGWVLVMPPSTLYSDMTVSVYVDKQYRRMGIGSSLIAKAYEYTNSIKQSPSFRFHDKPSKEFYKSLNIPKKYIHKN